MVVLIFRKKPLRGQRLNHTYTHRIMGNVLLIFHVWIIIVAIDMSPSDQANRDRCSTEKVCRGMHVADRDIFIVVTGISAIKKQYQHFMKKCNMIYCVSEGESKNEDTRIHNKANRPIPPPKKR